MAIGFAMDMFDRSRPSHNLRGPFPTRKQITAGHVQCLAPLQEYCMEYRLRDLQVPAGTGIQEASLEKGFKLMFGSSQ